MTIVAARVLEAWSGVFSSPVITELTPVVSNDGKVCATDDGAPYAVFPVLPTDSDDNGLGLDPVLAENIGATIAPRGYDLGYYMTFAVRWWLGSASHLGQSLLDWRSLRRLQARIPGPF